MFLTSFDFHTSFDSNIRSAYFCTKGARARVNFPAVYFMYFEARIAQTPSLLFVDIMKDKTPQTKISQVRESISM